MNAHATLELVAAKTRAAERLRRFLLQRQADWVAESGGQKWGFQTWAAGIVRHGIKPSTISRYMEPDAVDHDPRPETIQAFVDGFKLRPDWFLLPKLAENASYRDFLFGTTWIAPPSPYDACERFLARAESEYGLDPVTEDERAFLRSQTWPSEPTPQAYNLLLMALRACGRPASKSSPGALAAGG